MRRMSTRFVVVIAVAAAAWGDPAPLAAQPVDAKLYREQYEKLSKNAELIAKVRVLAAVCTAVDSEGPVKTVTLQLSLQVLDSEKGAKKNDVLVVARKVTLPAGGGQNAYGYMSAVRQFPFIPGVEGSMALRWDKDTRAWVAVAGWVPTAVSTNPAEIPSEVGKAYVAGDQKRMN
jgi:hypothetical protein